MLSFRTSTALGVALVAVDVSFRVTTGDGGLPLSVGIRLPILTHLTGRSEQRRMFKSASSTTLRLQHLALRV